MEVDICPETEYASKQKLDLNKFRIGVLAGNHIYVECILKHLMNCGYKLFIWAPLKQLREELMIYARKNKGYCRFFSSPTLLVTQTDIVISCLESSDHVKKILIMFGIMDENDDFFCGKIYVEMTNTDCETSKQQYDLFHKKEATYLEAMVLGTQADAYLEKLIILLAGDNSVFLQHQSLFSNMGKAIFLGEAGSACRIHVIFQVMKGVLLAGLSECFAFAERNAVELPQLQEIIKLMDIRSNFFDSATEKIVQNKFDKIEENSLKQIQQNCFEALNMSDTMGFPLPLVACLSQICKRTSRLGFGFENQDVGSIYTCIRY